MKGVSEAGDELREPEWEVAPAPKDGAVLNPDGCETPQQTLVPVLTLGRGENVAQQQLRRDGTEPTRNGAQRTGD